MVIKEMEVRKMFKRNRMRKGVASFYIVVFSTLVLVIVAASFATVIVSEITRTSNDDLSQSAYDSALAGVEDAKVAFADYQRCVEAGEKDAGKIVNDGVVTCGEIIHWMKNPDCYMVGHILGRIPESSPNENDNGEVSLGITSSGSGGNASVLNQAYSCTKMEAELTDYRSTISAAHETRLVKVRFTQEEANVLDHIKLSWYVVKPDTKTFFAPTKDVAGTPVATFRPKVETQMIVPPTVELQLLQTSNSFLVDQVMDRTRNGQTDRATLYLVPTDSDKVTRKSISAAEVASTNDPRVKNLPYLIKCDGESTNNEFVCSTEIALPEPIDGNRSGDTFMIALSLPYRQPETDFSVEFYCRKGTQKCGQIMSTNGNTTGLMTLYDAQVEVDSTGRANDLFRRVKARLETQDVAFPYPIYALQVLNDKNNYQLIKNMIVTCENSLWASNSGFGWRPDGVSCK